ncbi:retinol dehydrogenase 12-like [Macrobrachium nipponense]|uniref:retinol dehydrogenase 12-like n=1 Tax=Macrobrachium nipponense TaxID=159736 RepID=UPI0030C8B99A
MWLWLTLLLLATSVFATLGIFGIVHRERAGEADTKASLAGKTILITGASSGIGREAAKILAKRGARLILACRSIAKTRILADDLRSMTGNEDILVMELDTSSPPPIVSVRRFADKFLNRERSLDVLILNAGIYGTQRRHITSECLETVMATNHFGHFLLANLLLGALMMGKRSRIVVTASGLHRLCKKIDPKDLNFERAEFTPLLSYCQSKACNILFTRHLAEITRDTGVVVNAFCPGLVSTEMFEKTAGFFMSTLQRMLLPFIGRTPWQGAQPIVHLAASKETEEISGEFFEDFKVSQL